MLVKKYLFFIIFVLLAINSISNSVAYGFDLTYTDLNGNSINYSIFQGKYLIVEAMNTECIHCQDEAPVMDGVYQTFTNLTIVSITVNPNDTVSTMNAFNQYYNVNWLSGFDTGGKLSQKFNIQYTPTILFFDANGNLVHSWVGYTTFTNLKSVISEYVNVGNPSYSYTNTNSPSSPQHSLFGDIIGSPIFQGTFLLLIVILLYTKLTGGPKTVSK